MMMKFYQQPLDYFTDTISENQFFMLLEFYKEVNSTIDANGKIKPYTAGDDLITGFDEEAFLRWSGGKHEVSR
jgi:hypothetical protein